MQFDTLSGYTVPTPLSSLPSNLSMILILRHMSNEEFMTSYCEANCLFAGHKYVKHCVRSLCQLLLKVLTLHTWAHLYCWI